MNWSAILLSLQLASVTMLLLLVLSMPLAYWLTYTRWRWSFVVEALVALPLILPPTVLGYYILVAIGPRTPLGGLYRDWFGHPLPFSFEGLVVGSMLFSLPFAVQPVRAAFSSVDRRLIEASWTLGVSRLGTFRRVILPLSLPGVVTAGVLSFAHTLGEFGVVLMVGGNIEGVTKTASIAIYEDVQTLDYAAAGQTALLLIAFSFMVLVIVYSLHREAWSPWPTPRDE